MTVTYESQSSPDIVTSVKYELWQSKMEATMNKEYCREEKRKNAQ